MTSHQIFAHLETVVLPTILHYQEDLTVIDRRTLKEYTGPFLLSYRNTGTHLLLLSAAQRCMEKNSPVEPDEQMRRMVARKRSEVAHKMQTHFLHFDGFQFHELTQDQALTLTDEYLRQQLAHLALSI